MVAPRHETSTTRPRPPMPRVVLATGALLLALIGAAVAQGTLGLAAYLVAAAVVPWAPRERLRGVGAALAWIGLGWCGFAIVRVPLGARVTAVFLPCFAAFALRVWALATEGVVRWSLAPSADRALRGQESGRPGAVRNAGRGGGI